MEFRDLKKQYKVLRNDIDEAISCVLNRGDFISGVEVIELERKLAEYVGTKYCLTCANGTDALSIALKALNIGKGHAVFVPDFTFFATAEAVAVVGATPIFVDINKNTFNMDYESLEKAILDVISIGELQPKVIIPVDLFGQPADYIAIKKIANKYNLSIIEDAAQGFGGNIEGIKAGAFGDIACTSFFPAKPLGCYGDGGAIFTNDDSIAKYIESIRVHGKGKHKYENVRIGMNSRLDTMQAAILLIKFNSFVKYELEQINVVARWYTEMLCDIVETPGVKEGYYSSWAQYTIKVENLEIRDELQKYLHENGIPSAVYYPIPLHEQEAFKELKNGNCLDNTKEICQRVLSLPIDPYKTKEEIRFVSDCIKDFFEDRK